MIAALYPWAVWLHVVVIALTAAAIWSGSSCKIGGNQRIALVIGCVTLFFTLAPFLPSWDRQAAMFHICVNMLAAVPLLKAPVTSRQQIIGATYLGIGTLHGLFYFIGLGDPVSVSVQWFASTAVDAAQAVMLLWWSGPNGREMLNRLVRRHDAVASDPSHYQAR